MRTLKILVTFDVGLHHAWLGAVSWHYHYKRKRWCVQTKFRISLMLVCPLATLHTRSAGQTLVNCVLPERDSLAEMWHTMLRLVPGSKPGPIRFRRRWDRRRLRNFRTLSLGNRGHRHLLKCNRSTGYGSTLPSFHDLAWLFCRWSA